ncbi:Zinc Finger Protein 75D [Manis pentadactyla]|nr:Zinc Finger Protein 75D [Manis pentadactyla]
MPLDCLALAGVPHGPIRKPKFRKLTCQGHRVSDDGQRWKPGQPTAQSDFQREQLGMNHHKETLMPKNSISWSQEYPAGRGCTG